MNLIVYPSGADLLEGAPVTESSCAGWESVRGERSVDGLPESPELNIHGVELLVVDGELIEGGAVEIEEAKLLGCLAGALPDEKGVDLEGEERRQGLFLGGRLAGLVIGDDQLAIDVTVDPIEDAADDDPVEVFEHV